MKVRRTTYSYILTFYKTQCIESISQLGISKTFDYILNLITRYIIAQFLGYVKLLSESIDHTGGGMRGGNTGEPLTASRQASSIQGVNSERVPRAPGERSEPTAIAFMGRPYKKGARPRSLTPFPA